MKNRTCVWQNIYNTARATHSRYYKYFAKHACDFSLILLEPCNFLYKFPAQASLTVDPASRRVPNDRYSSLMVEFDGL
jgi:hypothetical protein